MQLLGAWFGIALPALAAARGIGTHFSPYRVVSRGSASPYLHAALASKSGDGNWGWSVVRLRLTCPAPTIPKVLQAWVGAWLGSALPALLSCSWC